MINEADNARFTPLTKAILMIQVIGQTSTNFLNIRRLKREMQGYAGVFNSLSDEELYEFAEYFIRTSLQSKSYRTTFFGTVPMSDEGAYTRLSEDIQEIAANIPARFGLEEDFYRLKIALANSLMKNTSPQG